VVVVVVVVVVVLRYFNLIACKSKVLIITGFDFCVPTAKMKGVSYANFNEKTGPRSSVVENRQLGFPSEISQSFKGLFFFP